MIWATVSSQSCFCWLYRASPSFTAKNIINLILVLTIWWCPCADSSLVLVEEGICYDQCVLLAKLYLPLPCFTDFSGGSDSKASAYNAGDQASIPGSGRSPGEGNANPLLFFSWISLRQRNLVGYSPGSRKESDMPEQFHSPFFSCFILNSKAKFACYSRCFLTSFFCIPVPYNEKDILFWVLVLKGLIGLHRTVQLQLLQHYWSGNRLGLPWYWMVCLGNEQRSFCHFWVCIEVLHFKLFCWLWWLLHFF